ncbi:MAG: hypothetical protein K6B52_00160 [Clostridiales bacterium]|nr:hypothetical protein [Clostridiales bacterium]
MSMTEKVAYLKGLADGLAIDESKPESKLIKSIIGVLDDMAAAVDAIDEDIDEVCEQLDAVDEDLGELEEFVYDEDCCCGCDDDDYDDFDDDEDEDEDDYYDVECPDCGEVITIDSDILEEGSIECPNCGASLEFDVEEDEADE